MAFLQTWMINILYTLSRLNVNVIFIDKLRVMVHERYEEGLHEFDF